MRDAIFVTGGSGFVGRPLLAALAGSGRPVVALSRSGTVSGSLPGVTLVTGDLLEPETYRDALRSCGVVLHLAAATGRAPAEEHVRVNARGTETLLEECARAGVERFVFVSSIATTFPDTASYHYARAKRRAEDAVRRSGIPFVILRPTIILGPGAPILKSLEKLALLPVVPLPGPGRARVQPIHVTDVVESILRAARADAPGNETIEIGGPEIVTIEALLRRLRLARRGTSGPLVHLPLTLVQAPLRVLEALGLGRMLPLSAGQLTSFRFDGVASPDRAEEGRSRIALSQMLDTGNPAPGTQPLDAECRTFTRHLIGREPDDYVRAKYAAAHAEIASLAPADPFEEALVAFARVSPVCAKLADSYASVLAPATALRRKLVLLLAILETRPPFHETIDAPIGRSGAGAWLSLLGRAIGFAAALIAGALLFVPARMVLARSRKSAG